MREERVQYSGRLAVLRRVPRSLLKECEEADVADLFHEKLSAALTTACTLNCFTLNCFTLNSFDTELLKLLDAVPLINVAELGLPRGLLVPR